MFSKNVRSKGGLTLIELIIALFIINIVVLSMVKAFASSLSMVASASHSNMALALAQESLEKIRYEKEKYTRNDAVNGWKDFYEHFSWIEQTSESEITKNEDGTLEDKDPCTEGKRIRFLNTVGDSERSEKYRPISTADNRGHFIVFTDESDKEKIDLYSGTGETQEPITLYRQVICQKIGESYGRNPGDVLEFIVQVDWEYKGNEYAIPLKMEMSNK